MKKKISYNIKNNSDNQKEKGIIQPMGRKVPKEARVQTEKKKDPKVPVIKRKGVSLITLNRQGQ